MCNRNDNSNFDSNRGSKGNSDGDNYRFDPRLIEIIAFEYRVRVVYGKPDAKTRRLFDKVYDLVRAGESDEKIASVLKQIKELIKRAGSIKDRESEDEEDGSESG